jgi:hypothetical protein
VRQMDGLSPFPSSGGVAPPASLPGSLLNMQVFTLPEAALLFAVHQPVRAVSKPARELLISLGYPQNCGSPNAPGCMLRT